MQLRAGCTATLWVPLIPAAIRATAVTYADSGWEESQKGLCTTSSSGIRERLGGSGKYIVISRLLEIPMVYGIARRACAGFQAIGCEEG